MIVHDTHALLWWALDPDRLSPAASARVREMERRGGFASAISIWELGVKIQRGKLDLGISIAEFARRIDKSAIVQLLAVDTATWLRRRKSCRAATRACQREQSTGYPQPALTHLHEYRIEA